MCQWQELLDSRPPPDYEDPDELEAIRVSKERSGDFKLKSAHDYVVPEHLRMNAAKVTDHIADLRQAVRCILANHHTAVPPHRRFGKTTV